MNSLSDMARKMREGKCFNRGAKIRECNECHVNRPVHADGACFACHRRAGNAGRKIARRNWTLDEERELRGRWLSLAHLDVHTRIAHAVVLTGLPYGVVVVQLVRMGLLSPGYASRYKL